MMSRVPPPPPPRQAPRKPPTAVISVSIIAGIALLAILLALAASHGASNRPELKPKDAIVSAAPRFAHFKNQLGDPLEALNVPITTNIPADVYVQVSLNSPDSMAISDGDNYQKCIDDGCLVQSGSGLADWWCSNSCPAGAYQVTLTICSYAENKDGLDAVGIRCNKQTDDYLAWIGKLGVNLKGNQYATADPDHAAILNLQRVVKFSHP